MIEDMHEDGRPHWRGKQAQGPHPVEWKCCGCGRVSPDRARSCECITGALYREEGGHLVHELKIDRMAQTGEIERLMQERDAALLIQRNASVALDRMRSVLQQCEDYFDDRADVVDGSYGEPAPNAEMQLLTEIREVLGKAHNTTRGVT